jgi:5-methylcytosine-specific restriction endonuclease McrA
MMRLQRPVRTFEESIDACGKGITGNPALLKKLADGRGGLLAVERIYLEQASQGKLTSIVPVPANLADNQALIVDLCRPDLIKLYDQYLVPKGKPGREVYSDLLNAAREECPFCGGIGTPKTLDHFLPKARHPTFSVLPHNLVPCCRDCNMGEKGAAVANEALEVFLHPYVDRDIFFNQQWIFASYHKDDDGELGNFEYRIERPVNWNEEDVARAVYHFNAFGLAHKYALKAAQSLATVKGQIDAMIDRADSYDDIWHVVLQPGIEGVPFLNHWQRGMYQALGEALPKLDALRRRNRS